ncbi:hypothetical protein [Spiroplasma tabanidicola]|uniref:Uncharacterized protein n=1 Tax=Spiroplasma tabanidicola TaxID=324079 RepID=A0A6I6C588_9MOLU|nr:hypothetical protein [Spiroplasma tabanidicola]QGS52007.1 hypothetical protein STABA_v1c06460 [Spiroplasma tabanidicola]
MQNRDYVLIIFISIWLCALLVSGLLALFYSIRIKGYKTINNEYLKKFQEKQKDFKLEKVNINYKLPDTEVCYFNQNAIKIYYRKRKKEKADNKLRISDYKYYYNDNKLTSEFANLFLTNKHLVIEFKQKYLKVELKNIVSLICYTFYIGDWIKGIELVLANKRYLFDLEDVNLVLSFNELIKEQENGK